MVQTAIAFAAARRTTYFLSYLQGFLEGYFISAGKAATVHRFVRKINAGFSVYGYRDGEYFEESYDTEEKYVAAVKKLGPR